MSQYKGLPIKKCILDGLVSWVKDKKKVDKDIPQS